MWGNISVSNTCRLNVKYKEHLQLHRSAILQLITSVTIRPFSVSGQQKNDVFVGDEHIGVELFEVDNLKLIR